MSKNTITIKNKWDEITWDEFYELRQILICDIPEEYKVINIVSLLTGESIQTIENLPIMVFKKLANQIDFISDIPTDKPMHKDTYTVNGRTYYLKADIPSITTAQYIDYGNFSREEIVDMRKLVGCFLIPINHQYNDGYDLEEVWRDVGQMNFRDVQSVAFFLQKQYGLYIIITIDYLLKKVGKMKKMKKTKEEKQKMKELKDQLHHLQYMVYSHSFSESLN